MKLKPVAGIALITLALLLLIEFVSYSSLDGLPFFIDFRPTGRLGVADPRNGFNEIDPLLGYGKTTQRLRRQGFATEKGCITIGDTIQSDKRLRILVTGGSTSDLSLDSVAWPVELYKILKAQGISVKIYCAAVGGYNSGQELLKVIRDGVEIAPVIHISYSGANDVKKPSYVSVYEDFFYDEQLKKNTSWLMPSTVYLARQVMRERDGSEVALRPRDYTASAPFWEKNMRLMRGVSLEEGYSFAGFLQPVMGSGTYLREVDHHEDEIRQQRQVWPDMKAAATRHPQYLTDLSAIFDTCQGSVYRDNCHISDEYQYLVAQHIYAVLAERGLLRVE